MNNNDEPKMNSVIRIEVFGVLKNSSDELYKNKISSMLKLVIKCLIGIDSLPKTDTKRKKLKRQINKTFFLLVESQFG